MSRWFRKAGGILEAQGLRYLVTLMLRRLISPVLEFGRVVIFARDLNEDWVEPAGPVGFDVRLASASDVSELTLDHRGPNLGKLFGDRFRRGDACFTAIDPNGKVAHTRWLAMAPTPIPELDMEITPQPGTAYFYDGYTRRDVRGLGIDGVVRCRIFRTLREAGFERVYSYVRGDNPVGVLAASRWQKCVGEAWYLRLRGFRPLVITRGEARSLVARVPSPADEQERALRARAWREWFEGWLREPLEKRSTGFDALPGEYFDSVAEYIAAALKLDPTTDVALDVGCDSAMVSRRIAPSCRRFVGVDFVSGLLADIPRDAVKSAEGTAAFMAADGRSLPFRSHAFSKVYCSAVIHVLPSHEDGMAIIDELLRVCRPGGEVLVAAVPDTRKRINEYVDVWKRADLAGKLYLIVSLLVPRPLKKLVRRFPGLAPKDHQVILYYHLHDLKRRLESRGLECQVLDFPPKFWSRDFRRTRSNLLIRLPARWRLGGVANGSPLKFDLDTGGGCHGSRQF